MVGAMSIDIDINRRSLNPDFQILSSYLKIISTASGALGVVPFSDIVSIHPIPEIAFQPAI